MSLAGIAGALLGHSFSIFIGFKGGKGVATAMGGMLAIMAPVVLLGIVLWVIVFYAFRYVSLASIVFAASLPVFTWLLTSAGFDWPRSLGHVELGIAIGIAVLIVLRHIPNIQRLLNGTEHQFKKKPSNAGASSQ
jgi:acyl phosphate:glycerol-3-phosphate acyltransferase